MYSDNNTLLMPEPKHLPNDETPFWNESLVNFSKGRRLYKKHHTCPKYKSKLYYPEDEIHSLERIKTYFNNAIGAFKKLKSANINIHIKECQYYLVKVRKAIFIINLKIMEYDDDYNDYDDNVQNDLFD